MKIIYDMPLDEYHAHPALGSSGMKEILRSPKHFWEKYINTNHVKDEPTEAMRFGNLYDCIVLEPEKFKERYTLEDSLKIETVPEKKLLRDFQEELGNKEEAKAAYTELNTRIEKIKSSNAEKIAAFKNSGKEIISYEDYLQAEAMKDNLMAKNLSFIIEDGIKQAPIFWIDEETGVECKCRPDIMREPGDFPSGILLDLKSTADASPEGFGKQVFNLGYQISAAHYINGFKQAFKINESADVPWYWVCSEKKAPYESVYRPITFDQLIHGQHNARKALRLFAEAKKSGIWKGYSETPEPAITPGWIQREINLILEGETL